MQQQQQQTSSELIATVSEPCHVSAQTDASTRTIRWVGTTAIIVCAGLIDGSLYLSQQALTFSLFVLGHGLWLYAAWREKDRPLQALNVAMLLLDGYAIAVRLHT